MRKGRIIPALAAILMMAAISPAMASPPETADVMDQGGAGVYAPDGARLVRQTNGIRISVSMPAPQSGMYEYPADVTPGSPEVFTLWAFVFNHPEECTDPCGGDDTTNPAVEFGAYNVAGHVNAGKKLTLSGRIGVGDPAGGPVPEPQPLSNPAGAEIHLAVTSHGALNPATLPGEFRRPTGSPMCSCWWVAVFD